MANLKVAFMAHCFINQNAKVDLYARGGGILIPLVEAVREQGWEVHQLPCPEMGYAGVGRWWASKEILDKESYREHCRDLATATAADIQRYRDQGYLVSIIGSDGSPSSGVRFTGSAPRWGGLPEVHNDYEIVPGMGVWMEVLKEVIEHNGHEWPPATGVLLDGNVFDWDSDMPVFQEELRQFLSAAEAAHDEQPEATDAR